MIIEVKSKILISKSEFMMFLRHPAWIWLKKYAKDKLPEPDAELQARFDEGTLFESYAEKLFPNAVRLGYKNGANFSGTKYWALPEETKALIQKKTEVILQGRVETENLTSIFDVLERVDDNLFDLYEIKSSTSVKPEHIPDLAFQTIVLEDAGFRIRKISVIHVNNQYIRHGEIEPKKITSIAEVTEDVRTAIEETKENITRALKVLSLKEMPNISPRYLTDGDMAEWLQIYEGIKGKSPDHSIYDLCGLDGKMVGQLEDVGISLLSEIPEGIHLNERQRRQVDAVKLGEQSIDQESIRDFIDSLKFPIHFFDYETIAGVIPAFDGTKPYQQVPFQYSLHIWEKPDSEPVHLEFLHTERTNPVPQMLEQMQKDFEGKGSIIAWNMKFEVGRNKEMALQYPKYEKFLLGLNERMVDLMFPFSKGWFIDKEFYGSASLKAVLPVLIPSLSYKELEVSHGGQAQRLWMETVLDGKNADRKDKIMENLLKYCERDTFSLFAILKYLSKRVATA